MALGFGSLEIARSGLYTNERGLFVTGHNISNVNTLGYVRQQAMITTANYYNTMKYQLGLGADIAGIRQIRHQFLDNMYRSEAKTLGYWEARQKTFTDVQAILGEPMADGLQDSMNMFWDAWQELSKDPGSLTTRAMVRQRANTLVQYINHMGSQLDRLQEDLNSEIIVRIDEINDLTASIAKLNVEIAKAEAMGDAANDLRDQRNLNIDKLSKLIGCEVSEGKDGQVSITVGGYFIVNKDRFEPIKAVPNKPGSLFVAPAIGEENTILQINSGTLKGLLESRGEVKYTKGSTENGSPYDKMNLVFAFNLNDSVDARDELLARIDSIVKTYTEKGIQVKLGFVTFDENGVRNSTTFANDVEDFKSQVGSLVFDGGVADAGDVSAALKDALDKTNQEDEDSGWTNAAKQFILFSESTVDVSDAANVDALIKQAKLMQKENAHTLIFSGDGNKDVLGAVSEISGDRFIISGLSTPDTSDDVAIDETILESMRNSIFGDVESTGNIIPDIRKQLNLIVSALVREVNRLHRSGTTLEGNPGEDFFVPIDPNYPLQMGNIQINPIFSDAIGGLNNIVASLNSSTGDNTIALEIANLRSMDLVGNFGQVQNLDEFYQSIIMLVGNGGSEATSILKSQDTLVNSIDNQRQSIMGVSMDEEMTNMMKYQFAYGASGRVINILDEMYDTIINRMGA
ncbi:flagellar hook-associated protein FlgK [Pseudoclostridium thermosuccinogenes]|uniref:flagellar hook-associated protein FlgK n=1 Tax=Clostridium thermosuccinogenes TaxID=84032 RepID=UPI002FDA9C84